MTTPPAEAKAQHYIPKFYLKGFTDRQGKLWVCEKFKPIRASKPKTEAPHAPTDHTHAERGERDETAEDILEEVGVEGRTDRPQTRKSAIQTDTRECWLRHDVHCLHVRQSPELA